MFCSRCHLRFPLSCEKVRVGKEVYHLHCFEALMRETVYVKRFVVLPAAPHVC